MSHEVEHHSLGGNWENSALAPAPNLAAVVAFSENHSVHTWCPVVLYA